MLKARIKPRNGQGCRLRRGKLRTLLHRSGRQLARAGAALAR
jgi:hypothetical protein